MTESYSHSPRKSNLYLKEIGLVVLGVALTISIDAVKTWYSSQLETVVFQTTLTSVDNTTKTLVTAMTSVDKRLSDIEHAMKPVEALEGRIAKAEERQRADNATLQAHEAQIRELQEKMKFYHHPGDDKERRTLDEWIEEYEKRQKQKQQGGEKRGRFDDSWDGAFNSFRKQEY